MPTPASLSNGPETPELIIGKVQSVSIDPNPDMFAMGFGGFVEVNGVQYLVPSDGSYPPNNTKFNGMINDAYRAKNEDLEVRLHIEVPEDGEWAYITVLAVIPRTGGPRIPHEVGEP